MTASTDTQAGALVGAPAIPKLDNGVEPFADTQAHGGGVEAVRSAQAFLERLIDLVSKAAYEYDERGNTDAFTHFGQQVAEWQFDGTFASYRDELAAALAASPAAAATAAGVDAQFTALRVAYKRGVAWAIENPGANSSLVEKAAYDYADKATSVALIDEHLTPGFSDVGDCCAGKLAAPPPPDAKER